jgi:hypothetical protein
MCLILPVGRAGGWGGVKGLGRFVCSHERGGIWGRRYCLEVCGGTLKEGMFRSETGKDPAGRRGRVVNNDPGGRLGGEAVGWEKRWMEE